MKRMVFVMKREYVYTDLTVHPRITGMHDYLWGNLDDIRGDVSGIRGDISDLSGDVTGLKGDVSNLFGNLDDCEITQEQRDAGVYVEDLIEKDPIAINFIMEKRFNRWKTLVEKKLKGVN